MHRSPVAPHGSPHGRASLIDLGYRSFVAQVQAAMDPLDSYSSEALLWLMREHFALAAAKPEVLQHAAYIAQELDTPQIGMLLRAARHAEYDQSVWHRAALDHAQINPLLRIEFAPTTSLVERLHELIDASPSSMLGVVYVLQHGALFEHFLLHRIAQTLIARLVLNERGRALLDFHQTQQDQSSIAPELDAFLVHVPSDERHVSAQGARPSMAPLDTVQGGLSTVELLLSWWQNLVPVLVEKSARCQVS